MNAIHHKIKALKIKPKSLTGNKKYSISFYTGGVDIKAWAELSNDERKKALSKSWYLRLSLRNPKTGYLKEHSRIKRGLNRYHTKHERYQVLKILKRDLAYFLDSEYDVDGLVDNIYQEKHYTIKEALVYALSIKKETVAPVTYQGYFYEAENFISFLGNGNLPIEIVDKIAVSKYLNKVLKDTTARTRNNARSNLSALFTVLSNEFIIKRNFIKTDISKIETAGKIDRTFSIKLLLKISMRLKKHDPKLLFYIKIVSYNFVRGIEVNRLFIKNIDLKEKRMVFKAKNKKGNLKIKRIPEILIPEFEALELEKYNPDDLLFSYNGNPGPWDGSARYRQSVYGKRFKVLIKDHFNLGKEYGINSFRHTYATLLFQSNRVKKNMSFNEAIDAMLPITGHNTRDGLVNYIHKIDADIPQDWSDDFEVLL